MRPIRSFFICLLLSLPSLAPAANKYALVKAKDDLTLRAAPSPGAARVETILRFQPVEILERKTVENRNWARIRTLKAEASKSSAGWVLADYLSQSAFAISADDKLNVRRGPGTNYDVIMHYGRNYPVQVMDVATNGWVKLKDADGDMGWAHPTLLALDPPWVITDGPYKIFNVREGIGAETPLKYRAEKGYPLQVIEEKNGWLHVRDREKAEGWISAKIVFGWLDPAPSKAANEEAKPAAPSATAAKKDSDSSGTQKQLSAPSKSDKSDKAPAKASANDKSSAKSGTGDKAPAKSEKSGSSSAKSEKAPAKSSAKD